MTVTLKDILPLLDKDGMVKITQDNVTTIHASPNDLVLESYEGTEVVKKIDIVDDPSLSIIHHIILEDTMPNKINDTPRKIKSKRYEFKESDWENVSNDSSNPIYRIIAEFPEVKATSITHGNPTNTDVVRIDMADGKFEIYSFIKSKLDIEIDMWQMDYSTIEGGIVFNVYCYDPEIWSCLRNEKGEFISGT